MPFSPKSLRNLPSREQAQKTAESINFEARSNADQMNEAFGHLSKMHQHIGMLTNQHPNNMGFMLADLHLQSASNNHSNGNIDDALSDISNARSSIGEGVSEAKTSKEFNSRTDMHSKSAVESSNNYTSTANPAKVAAHRSGRPNIISVSVAPNYLEKVNPQYAIQRKYNQAKQAKKTQEGK